MPYNHQDIEIRSEEVQEILTYIPNRIIRWGNSLFVLLILMLLSFTWFIKYPDVITTQIMITTINPPEKLYANSQGKFEVIFVNDGDSITIDQPLAVIENTALYQDVFLLKSIIDTLTFDRNKLFFPISDLPPLVLGDINTSFANFENSYSEYQLNKKLNPYKNESIANQLSIIEARRRLQILRTQKELNLKELTFKEKDLKRQKSLFNKGVISAKDYEQRQIEWLQTKKAFQNLQSAISQIREVITNSEKNLKGNNIENIQKESRLLKKAIQSFYQLKKVIKNWEKQYVFKASIDGQVSFLSYWNKNQTVKKGEQVFTIIPMKNNSFIGKIEAPAINSGKIKSRQKVHIQLINYPSDQYGELNGKVTAISLVPNQDGNYLIDVKLPKKLITTYHKEIEFRQEMKGLAYIITEDLRLSDRIFYKLKNIIN